MSKITDNYRQLAAGIGFGYDEPTKCIYGQRNGYEYLIYAFDQRYPYLLQISTSAKSMGCVIGKEESKLFTKSVKPASGLVHKDSLITVTAKNTPKQESLRDNINFILDALSAFLNERGFTPCCQICGSQVQTTGFAVQKAYMHLCPECGTRLKSDNEVRFQSDERKNGNLIGGIVGALLGALLGIASMLLFNQMGYVASISGVILAVCVVKGFELLGGRLNKLGIAICCIIMLIMPYIGNRLICGVELAKVRGFNVFDGFQAVSAQLAYGMIDRDAYMMNLAMLYLFTIVGAVPTIMNIVRNTSFTNRVSQIGQRIG